MIDLTEVTNEELLELKERLETQREEIMGGLLEIRSLLLERLQKEKLDSKVVGDYILTQYKQVNFTATRLEQAKELSAVKEVTKIMKDTTKLRKLFDAGVKVPGVSKEVRIRIAKIKE